MFKLTSCLHQVWITCLQVQRRLGQDACWSPCKVWWFPGHPDSAYFCQKVCRMDVDELCEPDRENTLLLHRDSSSHKRLKNVGQCFVCWKAGWSQLILLVWKIHSETVILWPYLINWTFPTKLVLFFVPHGGIFRHLDPMPGTSDCIQGVAVWFKCKVYITTIKLDCGLKKVKVWNNIDNQRKTMTLR